MKKIVNILLVMFVIISSQIQVNAVVKPNNDFYVLDEANVFTPAQREEIINTSTQVYDQTKAQMVIVTVKSLDGMSMENYAYDLYNSWQIGDKDLNNGILIVFAPNEREYRIMTGPGLEDVFTARFLGTVRDDVLLPGLKTNDYGLALMQTYNVLLLKLQTKYPEMIIKPLDVKEVHLGERPNESLGSELISMLLLLSLFGVGGLLFMPRRRNRYGRSRYGSPYNRSRMNNQRSSYPRRSSRGGGGRTFGGGIGGKF